MVARYAAFQLPELALVTLCGLAANYYWGVPAWVVGALVTVWILKDVAMFPLVRVAYEPHDRGGTKDLIDAVGIAQDDLEPAGYVRLRHELWRAERASGADAVATGDPVRVCEVEGLTLRVEPAPGREPGPPERHR